MAFSPERRRAPHNVAPTTHSLRDWDPPPLSASAAEPSSSFTYASRPTHVDDGTATATETTNRNYGAIVDDRGAYDDDDDIDDGRRGGTFDRSTNFRRNDERAASSLDDDDAAGTTTTTRRSIARFRRSSHLLRAEWESIESFATRIPAIFLVALFHLMIGIPFGVSYFPIGWRSSSHSPPSSLGGGEEFSSTGHDDYRRGGDVDGDFVLDGPFPVTGKEALGIRMFFLSTIIGQLALTYSSNFDNCIALQMVENVPFTNALSRIVVELVGYGEGALSTLFFVFGLSSLLVGCVFYLLGRMELGRILYFFPR